MYVHVKVYMEVINLKCTYIIPVLFVSFFFVLIFLQDPTFYIYHSCIFMSIFTQAYNSKSKEFEDPPLSARKRSKGKVYLLYIVLCA